MIQDIFPKHLYNSYQNKQPLYGSYIAAFSEKGIFLKKEGKMEYPVYGQIAEIYRETCDRLPECRYLFSIEENDYFLFMDTKELKLSGFCYFRMFETRRMEPKEQVFAAATAWHLYEWYRDNKFCGRCGKKLIHSEKLRMLQCENCGNMVFPKIAPAVIVGIISGDKILMTKYANREYKRYALIAGFTEIGETAEETVEREVFEEVGLHVKNIRYYKSQPWGFDSNLLLGYFCELDDDGSILLDTEELAEAEWVHFESIEDDKEGLSLTKEMMLHFRNLKRRGQDIL